MIKTCDTWLFTNYQNFLKALKTFSVIMYTRIHIDKLIMIHSIVKFPSTLPVMVHAVKWFHVSFGNGCR